VAVAQRKVGFRPLQLVIPRHTLSYGFAATIGCTNNSAGLSGNRTSFSDTKDGAAPTTTTYCYDWADRLISTTVTGTASSTAPNPVADGLAPPTWPTTRTAIRPNSPTRPSPTTRRTGT
jgi:hypothetical protein